MARGPFTLAQFRRMAPRERLQQVYARGTYLITVQSDLPYDLRLYALDGFFVELWVTRKLNKVTQVTAFDSTRELLPYLTQVEVRGVV